MASEFFTIGYQAATLEEVVASLRAAGIALLVDTRETPVSRRAEFRQRPLAQAVESAGIRYLSIRAVGAPKPLRLLAARDWAAFTDAYRQRLDGAGDELEELVRLISTERVCLLCYEADAARCHRSLLCEEIRRRLDVPVVHLRPSAG